MAPLGFAPEVLPPVLPGWFSVGRAVPVVLLGFVLEPVLPAALPGLVSVGRVVPVGLVPGVAAGLLNCRC